MENVTAENSISKEQSNLENERLRPEMRVYFEEINTYLGNEIKLPESVIKTDIKKLTKLKKALEKDPEGFFKLQIDNSVGNNGQGLMPTFSFGSGMIKTMKENNPIEKVESQ